MRRSRRVEKTDSLSHRLAFENRRASGLDLAEVHMVSTNLENEVDSCGFRHSLLVLTAVY
jgi:hypothetical protein